MAFTRTGVLTEPQKRRIDPEFAPQHAPSIPRVYVVLQVAAGYGILTGTGEAGVENEIRSVARKDRKTKKLVQRIKPGEIAVIDHPDIDRIAAEMLVKARPRLVINAGDSISGRYPNPGPGLLLAAGIPVLDRVGRRPLPLSPTAARLWLKTAGFFFDRAPFGEGRLLTNALVEELVEKARLNLGSELENFVRNTLEYALKERISSWAPFPCRRPNRLPEETGFGGGQGENYREDLQAIGSYLREVRPVLVGVDGGADALLEAGFLPDLIIGDMDSVSDEALLCGAELVVHAYPDGRAPGMERLQRLGKGRRGFCRPRDQRGYCPALGLRKRGQPHCGGGHPYQYDRFSGERPERDGQYLFGQAEGGFRPGGCQGVSLLYRNAIKAWQIWLICLAAVIPLLAFFSLALPGDGQRLVAPLWLRIRVFLACKNVLGLKSVFGVKDFRIVKGQSLMIIDLRYHIFSWPPSFSPWAWGSYWQRLAGRRHPPPGAGKGHYPPGKGVCPIAQ